MESLTVDFAYQWETFGMENLEETTCALYWSRFWFWANRAGGRKVGGL